MRPSFSDVAAAQEGGWSAVNKLIASDAATSLVLKPWTGELAAERCGAAAGAPGHGTGRPFGTYVGGPAGRTFDGTGPSVVGIYARVDALVTGGMRTDQAQAVRIPAAVNGIPPRRTPPRC